MVACRSPANKDLAIASAELEWFPRRFVPWPVICLEHVEASAFLRSSATALPILVDSIQIHHALHNLLHGYLNAPALISRRLDRTTVKNSHPYPRRRDACAGRKEPAQARPCMSCIQSSASFRSGLAC